MTFNQWCSRYNLTPHGRIPLEAIWNALVGGGSSNPDVVSLMNELLDNFREKRQ